MEPTLLVGPVLFVFWGPMRVHPIINGRIVPLISEKFDSIVHLETSFVSNHLVRDLYLFGTYCQETNGEC